MMQFLCRDERTTQRMTSDRLALAVYERAAMLRPQNRSNLVNDAIQGMQWLADRPGVVYQVRRDTGIERVLVDPIQRTQTAVDDEIFATLQLQPARRMSPNGHVHTGWTLMTHGWNLWLVQPATDERIQLTFDGELDYAWGTARDPLEDGTRWVPSPVLWSPDGRYGLTQRMDYRGVRAVPLMESAPLDGGPPRTHVTREAWPGDEHIPHAEPLLVDVVSRTVTPLDIPPIAATHTSPLLRGDVWWQADGSAAYVVVSSRDWLTLTLYRVDPTTGDTRVLVTEHGDKRVRPSQMFHQKANVAVLPAANEVIWFSERDGWGHLYLYDATSGECLHQVTEGDFVVQELQHVDERNRVVLASVSGLIAEDPYRWTPCLIGIDTGIVTRVAEDVLHHQPMVAPVPGIQTGYIDIASTVETAPVATWRDWSGAVLLELEQADISRLVAAGWQAPQRFSALAADGETTIWGTLFLPPEFDPTQSYPILDHVYPGPQIYRALPQFEEDEVEPMAAVGLVGITIDGRGTPGRSRTFHDASWRNLGAGSGLEDHVAVIRQLAESRPWMDLSRVGVFGHSAGGYAAALAMEQFPEFYSVGIASAGRHDGRMVMAMILEAFDDPSDAESWARASAVEPGGNITGKLLVVQGEMDPDVSIHHAYRLIDRMIAANRDFDLLLVPGDDHVFRRHEGYVERRQWDYLVRNLMHREPPAGFMIPPTNELAARSW